MGAEFAQDCLDLPDKHTAIPDIVAVLQIALSGGAIGLFHEAFAGEHLVSKAFARLFRVADVAIAGLRRCTQGHELALAGCLLRQLERLPERFHLGNHVVS